MDSLPSRCLWIIILVFVIGVLRCFESCIGSLNEAKLQKYAQDGNKSAKRILAFTENSSKFYNSIKVLTVIAEIALVNFGITAFGELFSGSLPEKASFIVTIALLSVLVLIFGVYAPKRIADLHADKIVLKVSGILTLLYYIGFPISWILTQFSNFFLLFFGIKPNDTEDEVTEEEIRMMVDIGSESGAIDPEEKEMIHNIFELDDTQVGDIMTHRTDAELLWLDEKDKWEEIISESNHTVYPVCEETIDNIIGILRSKDFYKTLLSGGDVGEILRTPYFVPDTIKADDLFRQMQKTKNHFAVVLDEYGGLGGIITMSDLLEEIVGTLSNDSDESEDDDILQLDASTWRIAGSCDIDLVAETLGIELPIEEYNTFAGMVLSELGEIPEDGATPELEAYGLAIKVTEISEHRIEWTKVAILEKVQEDN